MFERVDTSKVGIDYDNYAYAYCQCPYPANIVYRTSKELNTSFKYYTCPECNTKIGVYAKKTKGAVNGYVR